MDDEFKLCWKNFQDNIASGFQNLYDRGDLVDVTLACDGKLLHAHKIVLAICSPYFQEIFITNPCKHPIIILKDVTFNIMCELLEFMYQGVVNVKHTELQSFMKIGQLLQIKGLATNSSSSAASTASSDKSSSQAQPNQEELTNASTDVALSNSNTKSVPNSNEVSNVENCSSVGKSLNTNASGIARPSSPPTSPSPMAFATSSNQQKLKSCPLSNPALQHPYHAMKRHSDFSNDALSIYSRKQFKRSGPLGEHNSEHNDNSADVGMDQVNAEDFFLPSIPHISMVESRYELNNVKRETDRHGATSASTTLRNSFGSAFGFDYNLYKNSSGNPNPGPEYPNDLHIPNDYSKNFGNHMDIPPNSSNVVMLSSTSLLHGNCVFNRNNTVATQQGMKTYWLCKSYRVSMCRARCITHQGRVISSTGVHNHPPHMRNGSTTTCGGYAVDGSQTTGQLTGGSIVTMSSDPIPTSLIQTATSSISSMNTMSGLRLSHSSSGSNMFQHNFHGPHGQPQHQYTQSLSPPPTANTMTSSHTHSHAHVHHLQQSQSNMLIQHQTDTNMTNNQGNQSTQPLSLHTPNSVIQNMMHNANILHLPNMPPMMSNNSNHHSSDLSTQPHPHPHQQQHHQQNVGPNLEITPLMESSPVHMHHSHSPSNRSNQSHHGGKSIESPNSVPGATMKSPQVNMCEDICSATANIGHHHPHILVHNAGMSPSDINSNGAASADASASSQSEVTNEAQHQAHVIDSITISPGNGQTFKMEDM